jgi:hypothetical protein
VGAGGGGLRSLLAGWRPCCASSARVVESVARGRTRRRAEPGSGPVAVTGDPERRPLVGRPGMRWRARLGFACCPTARAAFTRPRGG